MHRKIFLLCMSMLVIMLTACGKSVPVVNVKTELKASSEVQRVAIYETTADEALGKLLQAIADTVQHDILDAKIFKDGQIY